MTVLLRFADLRARNIVSSWTQLKRLQEEYGFPHGRMLTPNCRTWTEEEVDEWYSTRPVENDRPLQGAASTEGHKRALATKAARRKAVRELGSEPP